MSRVNHPWLRSLTGLLLLIGVLVMPHTVGTTPLPALPLLALIVTLALLPGAGAADRPLRLVATLGVLVLGLLKGADLAMSAAYSRALNPVTDAGLAIAAWQFAVGTVGIAAATAGLAAIGLALIALAVALFWGLGGLSRLPVAGRMTLAGLCGLGLLGYAVGSLGVGPRIVQAENLAYVADRARLVRTTYRELADFERALADDPLAGAERRSLFSALDGRDVVVIFVESYGRSAIEDSRYAETIGARLTSIDAQLARAGHHAVSGWLRSPTVGGMSWLAHGTLLSGLWIDNQRRYDRLVASDRRSLNRLFADAGWTTLAAMPAITMDWPEAAWFGYDQVLGAADLGYAGKPFNWVTMPDQYTLAAIQRLLARMDAPAMVETALISSHAPWTPIPHLVPWDSVGDGRIFNAQAEAGASPSEVWADPARVRIQYEKAVDYSLATIGDYMARFGEDTVFIVVGDHQPAPIITGDDASREVPIHIVTDAPRLLRRLEPRYWSPGMRPAPGLPVRSMHEFRLFFTAAMSDLSPKPSN